MQFANARTVVTLLPTQAIRVLCLCFVAVAAATARAQSALDAFNPNADGLIRVVAVQKDGKILLGGDFTSLTPNGGATVTRNHIARLNPDGTLDTAFNPNANNIVRTIVVQPDGKILIGGDFTVVNSTPRAIRNHIARLSSSSGTADSFDPNANDIVRSIVVQSDGKVVFGGDFTSISPNGGSSVHRPFLARVNADGTVDGNFRVDVDNPVFAVARQANGRILAGGAFTMINGQAHKTIVRLNPDGGVDTAFKTDTNKPVRAIVVQADGRILLGGEFTTIDGTSRGFIGRLNPDGTLDNKFNPKANDSVFAIAVQGDGRVLAGGNFTTIGGGNRNHLARLNALDGSMDSFDPNANAAVLALAVQQDGKVLAGGAFSSVMPDSSPFSVNRNFIARFEIDGRVDQTLELGANFSGSILATAVQTDGKIIVGGFFNNLLGLTVNNIARLNTDGTIDPLFNPMTDNLGLVLAIAVQADGKILIGGDFTSLTPNFGNTFTRNHIARLNSDGTVDPNFNPNANGQVGALAVQADGKILVLGNGGGFTMIGGQSHTNLARLDSTGAAEASFNPNPQGGEPTCVVVQSDGKILVGGSFHGPTGIAGQSRKNLARLNSDGSLDTNFQPEPDGTVFAIAPQTDGKIVVGGSFAHISAGPHNAIARIDGSSGIDDPNFNPNANGDVLSIAIQSDGKVLASGRFTNIGGTGRNRIARLNGTNGLADSYDPNANAQVSAITLLQDGKVLAAGSFGVITSRSRSGFARLTNDTAALQNIAVTASNITFTRGGSSPQFTRVTFESSTDNVNFTFLGSGTPNGTGWTLSGATLPSGQNVVVRARGFYRSASNNGSESVTGTRQTAFFPGNFVIGDGNVDIGRRVVFWSPQWASANSLSGGPAPASFQGFVDSTVPNPPACGGRWSTSISSRPPDSVPGEIDVIVASSINQSGNIIRGNIPEMAVVKTDPGYDPAHGHPGTGTVVSLGCATR